MLMAKHKTIDFHECIGTLLVYGAAGSSFGAIVYMKYEAQYPLLVIAAGQLVGLRMIPLKNIIGALVKDRNGSVVHTALKDKNVGNGT